MDDETKKITQEEEIADGKTVVLPPLPPDSETVSSSQPGKSLKKNPFFFKLKHFIFRQRRDVNKAIDSLHEREQEENVHFSDNEDNLEPLNPAYHQGEQFAEGGQGILFRGIDQRLERLVAIKSLRAELTDDAEQRRGFVSEARVTAQLDHPSIVPIYSLNSAPDKGLHLVMKQIKGETLKAYLEQVSTLYRLDGVHAYDERNALRYRLDVFLKICDALEYAHSRNIMHRDLKPANIMIGEYRETYIMDWGLAKKIHKTDKTDTKFGEQQETICGTPQYISPEALTGKHCDQRADIFSMGSILFELVMLKRAFQGKTMDELLGNIRTGNMEEPEHCFGAPVDRELKAIIRKALEPDFSRRYQQVSELSGDLRRYLMGLEVTALPDNPLTKAIRWFFLHRRLTTSLIFAVILVAAAALIFSIYREYRFSEQLRQREYAIGIADTFCSHAGYLLDEQFTKLELMTDALAGGVQFLIEYDPHPENNQTGKIPSAYPIKDLKREGSPTMLHSPFHHHEIDLENVVYNWTSDTDMKTLPLRVNAISRFIPRMLQTILESPFNAQITSGNFKQMKLRAIETGTPIIRVIFGFSDGLYVAYPASPAFPEQYDPRNRLWYRTAISNISRHRELWTPPYIDSIPQIGLVLSCTVPLHILGTQGNGICAVDISLSKLIEALHRVGNIGNYVMEKAIVDDNGRIIISTTSSFADAKLRNFHSADEKVTFTQLANPAVFQEIKARKFGVLTTQDSEGREILCAFFHITSLNWFYVEKIDFKMLLERYKNPNQTPEQDIP